MELLATNSSSSSVNASNVASTNSTNNNKTSATTPTTKVSNTTTLTTTKKTGGGSPSATANKTAYNNNDIGGIFKNKDVNLYDQNVVRPKLILVAANTIGSTNTNPNNNNNNNNNTSSSSISSLNKQKVSDEGVMTFALMSNTESNKKTPTLAACLCSNLFRSGHRYRSNSCNSYLVA